MADEEQQKSPASGGGGGDSGGAANQAGNCQAHASSGAEAQKVSTADLLTHGTFSLSRLIN